MYSSKVLLAVLVLGCAVAVLAQPTCTARWQCLSVSTDFNFVRCVNGRCQCRNDTGFTGAATAASKCACPRPNNVLWDQGTPFCVNLRNAVTLTNENNRESVLKGIVKTIYDKLIGDAPRIIAAAGQPLDDLFDINAKGRVTPIGLFTGIVFQQYFYALAASSFVSAVTYHDLRAEGNTVYVRADITFNPPGQFPRPVYNLTENGVFYFNNNNRVVAADLYIANLGFIQDIPPVPEVQAGYIQGLCAQITGNPQTGAPGTCTGANQQYANFGACVQFMSSIPFGSFNRGNSNSVTCRLVHVIMTAIPPTDQGANIHCAHVGPTGGGKCVDFPYESFYTNDIDNPFP